MSLFKYCPKLLFRVVHVLDILSYNIIVIYATRKFGVKNVCTLKTRGRAKLARGLFTSTSILRQIPVLQVFVTCGSKCTFKKSPEGLQLRETPAVTKNHRNILYY